MIATVDQDGKVTIIHSVVTPDQFVELTAVVHTESDDPSFKANEVVVKWVVENDWPEPTLNADGIRPYDWE